MKKVQMSKKIKTAFFILLCIALLGLIILWRLSVSNEPAEKEEFRASCDYFNGEAMEITDEYFILKPIAEWTWKETTRVKIPKTDIAQKMVTLEIGDQVRVAFNSKAMEWKEDEVLIPVAFAFYPLTEDSSIMPDKDVTPTGLTDYERIISTIRENASALSFLGSTDVDDLINNIDPSEIKRLYYANVDIPKTWAENKTVYSFMGDFVQIKVPVVQGEYTYVITLTDKNGDMYFLGASQGINASENGLENVFGFNQDDVKEILQKEGIEENKVEDFRYLCASQYADLLLVFIKTADEEYLIPYSGYDEDLGIQSGKLYLAGDLVSILSKYSVERR